MRFTRISATVVVAALVALAGFAGGATAAPTTDAVQQQDELQDTTVEISEMEVENLSTSMQLESGTLMVETADGTQQVNVDSGSVDLTNATVVVRNATLHTENGTLELEEATVMVTDGQVEWQSDQGSESIDLSDTNVSVEDETVTLEDITGEQMDMSQDMQDATITEMTMEGISGEASTDLMVLNLGATEATGDENVSVVVQNGNFSTENATVTLMGATVEGDTLQADSVQVEADSAEVEAERVVVLRGMELNEFTDVSESVQDASFQQSDVEVSMNDLSELLDQMMGEQSGEMAVR